MNFICRFPIDGNLQQKRKNQNPDAIFHTANGSLGIEITELKNFQPKNQGRMRKIVRDINKELQIIFDFPFRVNILFSGKNIKITDICNVKKYLLNSIRGEIAQYPNRDRNEVFIVDTIEECPHVWKFSVHHYDRQKLLSAGYRRRHVEIVESGWVNRHPEAVIIKALANKDKRIEEYKRNCTKCWLLMVADARQEESHFDFSGIKEMTFQSKFDRVFVYDMFAEEEIYELEISY